MPEVAAIPIQNPTELLTAEQLAERLQVSRDYILSLTRARARQKNPLPVIRITPFVLRFDWAACQTWLASRTDVATGRKPRAYHRQKKAKKA